MSNDQLIQKAFADMELASTMRAEADRIDFVAKKQLESIHSPAGPKGKRQVNQKIIADTLARRAKNMLKGY